MTDREIMQQALEALEEGYKTHTPEFKNAITALRQALAQPEQEPVAHTTGHCENHKQKGGCQLHNLQCGWPDCDRKPITTPPAQPVAPKYGAIIEVFGKDWRLDYMSLPVGKHKLYTQQYTYIAPLAEQEFVAHAVIAGALFDFMGWLTSRKERIVLSSADNASPAVEVITEFAKMRSLSLADAKVTDWQEMTRGNDAA